MNITLNLLIGRLVRGLSCALIFSGFLVDVATAQDWRFEPILRVGGESDDNATLNVRTDQEVELQGVLVDALADIRYSSPKSSFFLQPRFLLRNYPDEPDFDSDDIKVRSNYRYIGTYNTFGFRAHFDRQSVRTAERTDSDLEIEGPEEISGVDSGRVFRFGTRDFWRLSPYWNYRISETSSFGAALNYIDASYEEVFADLLRDYTDMRVDLNFRRSFSNVTTGLVTVTGRNYNSEGVDAEIKGIGALVGLEHDLTEKTSFTAMVGLEDTDQGDVNPDPEVVGFATLSRNLETIRMFVQYKRSISGNGASNLTLRDAVNLNFKRLLSERISAGIGVRAYRDNASGGSVDDRNYFQLHGSFRWYVKTYFAIEANYRYTVLDRTGLFGERTNSNRVTLWFVYQPNTTPKL
jgi:hypothetical protein